MVLYAGLIDGCYVLQAVVKVGVAVTGQPSLQQSAEFAAFKADVAWWLQSHPEVRTMIAETVEDKNGVLYGANVAIWYATIVRLLHLY